MLRDIFALVLKMSLSASWVILGIWVVRLFLRKAPRAYSYALWLLVLARLLCPVFPEADFSPMPEKVASGRVVQEFIKSDIPVYVMPNEPQRDETPDVPTQDENVQSGDVASDPQIPAPTLQQILAAVWAAGAAAMVLYSFVTLLLLKRKLRVSICLRDNIYLADHIDSPFVIGIFRPRIYLPSGMPDAQSAYIILHEKHHIRRLDPAVKLLFYGALCLHWFNPLAWLAFFSMTQDMEMSCDEAVMRRMEEDIRLDYAESLLSLASPRRRFGAAPLAFGEGDPKRRIKNVLNYRKPAFWVSILAVAAIVIAGVFFLSDPVEEKESDTYLAGKLLFQHMALSWLPENGNHHGLILVEDQSLKVGQNMELTIMTSEVWNRQQMSQFLTAPNLHLSEEEAEKVLKAYPGERIEVRRFYAIPGDDTPDYTLVFFDGKLAWFADQDFQRVYEVEAISMDPARIRGGLEYPGLNWGMTPQAVKKTLGLTNPYSYEEWFGSGDMSGLADHNYIVLNNFECFGMKASQVEFRFSDHDDDIEGFGLDWVKIEYDESVDLQSIRAALRDVYGPESGANTWSADVNAAEAMGEDILRLQYYEAGTPMDTYRFRSENLEEFRQFIQEIYLVDLTCEETASGCCVSIYAESLVHLQQWMEASAS